MGHRQAWGPAGGLAVLTYGEGMGESHRTGGWVGAHVALHRCAWFPCSSRCECWEVGFKSGLVGDLGQGCQPLPLTLVRFTAATLTQAHSSHRAFAYVVPSLWKALSLMLPPTPPEGLS